MAELLIASLVVAIAGALLVGGLVAANRSADLRIERALSTQLLASQLALLDDQVRDTTPRSGTFPSPLEEFTWTLRVDPASAPLLPLAMTTLRVTRKDHHTDVVTCRPIASQP